MVDFDPTSTWGDGDGVTAVVPGSAGFHPASFGSTWGDGDGATTAMSTPVWGGGDEVTAAILDTVWTRKRKHMVADRVDDTDDGATATAVYAAGIGHGDTSPGIDTGVAADAGRVAGGLPDRGLDVGASADAHSSATKKRRRKYNRETQDSQKHCRRMATFATARGSAPGSDPGPIEEYPVEDWAER